MLFRDRIATLKNSNLNRSDKGLDQDTVQRSLQLMLTLTPPPRARVRSGAQAANNERFAVRAMRARPCPSPLSPFVFCVFVLP